MAHETKSRHSLGETGIEEEQVELVVLRLKSPCTSYHLQRSLRLIIRSVALSKHKKFMSPAKRRQFRLAHTLREVLSLAILGHSLAIMGHEGTLDSSLAQMPARLRRTRAVELAKRPAEVRGVAITQFERNFFK